MVTLKDLIDQVGADDNVFFQICVDDHDWEDIDIINSQSKLLTPFRCCVIKALTAVRKDVFRFNLETEDD